MEPDTKTSVAEGVYVPEEMLGDIATQEDVATGDTNDVLQKSCLHFRETASRVKDTEQNAM